MSCVQTLKGIAKDCLNSIGGIKKVWLANSSDVAEPTTSGESGTYALASADMAKFKEYEVEKYTSSMTSTFNRSDNGATYWSIEMPLQFRRMTAEKSAELDRLASADLAVVALDNNGEYWFFNDAQMSGGTGQTGQAMDDLNGYTPTISATALHLPYNLASFEVGE